MSFERQFNNLKFLRLLSQTDVSVNIIRHRMWQSEKHTSIDTEKWMNLRIFILLRLIKVKKYKSIQNIHTWGTAYITYMINMNTNHRRLQEKKNLIFKSKTEDHKIEWHSFVVCYCIEMPQQKVNKKVLNSDFHNMKQRMQLHSFTIITVIIF